jgi:hypothetical protein
MLLLILTIDTSGSSLSACKQSVANFNVGGARRAENGRERGEIGEETNLQAGGHVFDGLKDDGFPAHIEQARHIPTIGGICFFDAARRTLDTPHAKFLLVGHPDAPRALCKVSLRVLAQHLRKHPVQHASQTDGTAQKNPVLQGPNFLARHGRANAGNFHVKARKTHRKDAVEAVSKSQNLWQEEAPENYRLRPQLIQRLDRTEGVDDESTSVVAH